MSRTCYIHVCDYDFALAKERGVYRCTTQFSLEDWFSWSIKLEDTIPIDLDVECNWTGTDTGTRFFLKEDLDLASTALVKAGPYVSGLVVSNSECRISSYHISRRRRFFGAVAYLMEMDPEHPVILYYP